MNEQQIQSWIKDGLTPEAIQWCETMGKEMVAPEGKREQALTTSQIRNVFGEVKKMQMKGFNLQSLLMLKPRLAYAAKRASKKGAEMLRMNLDVAIDAVASAGPQSQQQSFENFAALFEAILAYHRASGGK